MMYLALLDMMLFAVAQNDVAPLRAAMMRCLPLCARRHASLPKATSLGEADIICPSGQTSFQKEKAAPCATFLFGRLHRFIYHD